MKVRRRGRGISYYLPSTCQVLFFLFFLIYLFIFVCIGSLLLHAGFLSSCDEQGLLFVAVHGLLIVVASLVEEHGL